MQLTPNGIPPGRNSPCPCGSGRRYKLCCGDPARGGQIGAPGASTRSGSPLDALMWAALKAQKANDLDEAQRLYRAALDQAPENIDALHMLGVVHFSKGELDLAERLIAAAERLCDRAIPANSRNLALARTSAKYVRGEVAIRSYLQARDAQLRHGRGRAATRSATRCRSRPRS